MRPIDASRAPAPSREPLVCCGALGPVPQLHADAVRWFDRAIAADETTAAFFLNRADCHQTLGNATDALNDLERAKELSSHDAQVRAA